MGEYEPPCDHCTAPARWSIQNYEGNDMDPIVRWFACGRHVHRALDQGRWEVDAVQVMDLSDRSET